MDGIRAVCCSIRLVSSPSSRGDSLTSLWIASDCAMVIAPALDNGNRCAKEHLLNRLFLFTIGYEETPKDRVTFRRALARLLPVARTFLGPGQTPHSRPFGDAPREPLRNRLWCTHRQSRLCQL